MQSEQDFEAVLVQLEVYPVLGKTISLGDYVSIDLSVSNTQLNKIDISSSNELENFVWNHIKSQNSKVAFGGYLETRNIYNRSQHFNQQDVETERNIHLGVDLWIEAGTPIYAPLDGEIHSFKNNTNFGDYGPTIILKHSFNHTEFFTLYGHLSVESLSNFRIGDKVKKGNQIATLGSAEVNGDYPPHLHFQIIKNIENYNGDYPGVCSERELKFYKQNCPNPNILLRLS